MNRLFCILSLIAFVFLSCNHHHDLPEPAPKESKRTVIVYMIAENSLWKYAPSDSAEMAAAAPYIPDSVNFIVYKDGVELPILYTLSKKEGFRPWKKYTRDQDSADSLVMNDVLRTIKQNFPAEKYGLVLWSHGSGWIPRDTPSAPTRTIGVDNGRNEKSYPSADLGNKMNISELRWAINQNLHAEYILFDACFMQNIETAYELRNACDFIIGSPAEIPGDGAPYQLIMNELCSGDAVGIASNYFDYHERKSGVALSVIDCKKLENLAEKSKPYIQKIWSEKNIVRTDNIQVFAPFYARHGWEPEPFDIRSTMHKLLSHEEYETWNEALEQAVVFHKSTSSWPTEFDRSYSVLSDPEYYSGVGMFIPSPKYDKYHWNELFRNTSWYKAAGWETTGW